MQVSKRGVFIAYINVLLVTAIITVAVIKLNATEESQKRQHYVDMLGISCDPTAPTGANTTCGEHGQCKPLFVTEPRGDHICVCDDGYTHFDGVCDYLLLPQVCFACVSVPTCFSLTLLWPASSVVLLVLTGTHFFTSILLITIAHLHKVLPLQWWPKRRIWCCRSVQALDRWRFQHLVVG